MPRAELLLTVCIGRRAIPARSVNLVLLSGLPIARPRIPELDYAVRTPRPLLREDSQPILPRSSTSCQDPTSYIYPRRAVNDPCVHPSSTSATGTGTSLTRNAPSSHCSLRAQSSPTCSTRHWTLSTRSMYSRATAKCCPGAQIECSLGAQEAHAAPRLQARHREGVDHLTRCPR